jgi:hypothetical protein
MLWSAKSGALETTDRRVKMKKIIIITLSLLLLVTSLSFSQTAGGPAPASIGVDSAQQKLVEVSVTKFEDIAYWNSTMPLDDGFIQIRRFEGAPLAKEALAGEVASNVKERDKYVLGAKVQYIKRNMGSFCIFPVKPLPIEGITKTLSVWVVGRNYNHNLKILIRDYSGRQMELSIGKLNFMGWKKLTVAIPPRIMQSEHHFSNLRGIQFIGFRVESDLLESYGTYYIYFDDLRAVTDMFDEEYRDQDDMTDSW